jgi:hypothetical protein
MYGLETVAIGRKGFKIPSYDQLSHFRIATPRGVRYGVGLHKNSRFKVLYVPDYKNAIEMLLKKG